MIRGMIFYCEGMKIFKFVLFQNRNFIKFGIGRRFGSVDPISFQSIYKPIFKKLKTKVWLWLGTKQRTWGSGNQDAQVLHPNDKNNLVATHSPRSHDFQFPKPSMCLAKLSNYAQSSFEAIQFAPHSICSHHVLIAHTMCSLLLWLCWGGIVQIVRIKVCEY